MSSVEIWTQSPDLKNCELVSKLSVLQIPLRLLRLRVEA